MCKRKDKKNNAESAATVGMSGYIAQKTVRRTQVRPPGSVDRTTRTVSIGKSVPESNAPSSSKVTRKKALTGLEILLKILHGIKIAAITIGSVLAFITFLGFLYLFLALTGIVEPDPKAFFESLGF